MTQALNELGVNIEEFESGLESARLHRRRDVPRARPVAAPEALHVDDLRRALERLAGEIMVDLAVGEADGAPDARTCAPCAAGRASP